MTDQTEPAGIGPAGLKFTQPPWSHRDRLRITGVRVFVTAPETVALVVVRVDTSEPGLYGLGCATFTQRYAAVAASLETHLTPLIIGRHPGDIEDITRMLHLSSYWRNGPVLNNALSGIDMALWDIAGKRAGLPVYDLFGGRVRAAAGLYAHAGGATIGETLDRAEQFIAEGYQHVRLQVGGPGRGTYGAPGFDGGYPGHPNPDGWDVHQYLRDAPKLFAAARTRLGDHPHLLHDAHNRLTLAQAIGLCRALEPHRPFFIEDPLPPEHFDRLPELRAATGVPIATGELLASAPDTVRLIRTGAVDYLRLHLSAIGGLTPARKITVACELAGVHTAWHNPADVSPIGQAANLALNLSTPAFGVQETHDYPPIVHDMFPGTPTRTDGYLHPNHQPGLGVDFNPTLAEKYPPQPGALTANVVSGKAHAFEPWAAMVRRPDGGIEAP